MKQNSLRRLAVLAADLPESDLADVLELAERLHSEHCFLVHHVLIERDRLMELDLSFCRIEALADHLDRILTEGTENNRLQLGATMMLNDEVQRFRVLLDNLDL